jgi:hypothetical protein
MRRTLLLAAALALAACNDGDGSGATAIDPLVTDLIQNQTTEAGEPVEIDGQAFAFPASDTDFDDVLPPDTGPVVEQ